MAGAEVRGAAISLAGAGALCLLLLSGAGFIFLTGAAGLTLLLGVVGATLREGAAGAGLCLLLLSGAGFIFLAGGAGLTFLEGVAGATDLEGLTRVGVSFNDRLSCLGAVFLPGFIVSLESLMPWLVPVRDPLLFRFLLSLVAGFLVFLEPLALLLFLLLISIDFTFLTSTLRKPRAACSTLGR